MGNIKQIPRKNLPHSAILISHSDTKPDPWDENPPTNEPITLTFVRMDGKSTLTYSVDGADVLCSKTLYYDCVNSLPRGIAFKNKDKILFKEPGADKDTEYTIVTPFAVATDRTNAPIHHYELGVV